MALRNAATVFGASCSSKRAWNVKSPARTTNWLIGLFSRWLQKRFRDTHCSRIVQEARTIPAQREVLANVRPNRRASFGRRTSRTGRSVEPPAPQPAAAPPSLRPAAVEAAPAGCRISSSRPVRPWRSGRSARSCRRARSPPLAPDWSGPRPATRSVAGPAEFSSWVSLARNAFPIEPDRGREVYATGADKIAEYLAEKKP